MALFQPSPWGCLIFALFGHIFGSRHLSQEVLFYVRIHFIYPFRIHSQKKVQPKIEIWRKIRDGLWGYFWGFWRPQWWITHLISCVILSECWGVSNNLWEALSVTKRCHKAFNMVTFSLKFGWFWQLSTSLCKNEWNKTRQKCHFYQHFFHL